MGICISTDQSVGRKEQTGDKSCVASLVVVMADEKRKRENKEGWRMVSRESSECHAAESSECHAESILALQNDFPEHVLCDAHSLVPGQSISVFRDFKDMKGGDMYFLVPRHRIDTAFTCEDMAALIQRCSLAFSACPFFALSEHSISMEMCERNAAEQLSSSPSGKRRDSSRRMKFPRMPAQWTSRLSPILE